MIPVISIVGYSNSGKTTLLEKIIRELKKRNYKVAIIKHHAHHSEIDDPGKDSWRHAQAGADTVIFSSKNKWAMIQQVEEELLLEELINKITGVDIIITEGYKNENKPKIEVFRAVINKELISKQEELLAIASDVQLNTATPCFHIDDYKSIVDLIENTINRKKLA